MSPTRTPASLFLIVVLLGIAIGCNQTKTPDMTGEGPEVFQAHRDKIVSIRGRLEDGSPGLTILGGTRPDVAFYVIPAPTDAQTTGYPKAWQGRLGKTVRLTGKLRFRAAEQTGRPRPGRAPSDLYYMVMQQTRIEDAKP